MEIFKDKIVLVTGGTGSLGKVLVKRVLSGEEGMPKKVVVFSRDEAKQHYMRTEYYHDIAPASDRLEFVIGDIRNYASVCSVIKNVDIIINTAALKQVPVCEYFPEQAVLTNCMGVQNIIRAINENDYPVETVIIISTDKACKPVNVMGMTKAIQERMAIVANIANPGTRFICVRYGNIISKLSVGSVIPIFQQQIKEGGPVTVTSLEMTRFMFTMDQAVDIVYAAIREGLSGEVYIPILISFKMIDVARAMIGSKECEIKITGIRPGEKVHEIIISEDEYIRVLKRGDYYVIAPMLPELSNTDNEEKNILTGEYNSANVLIDFQETKDLLKKYNLLPE